MLRVSKRAYTENELIREVKHTRLALKMRSVCTIVVDYVLCTFGEFSLFIIKKLAMATNQTA